MAKNVEPILVSVRVNPVLRDYLLAYNGGSPVLVPDYKGALWVFVKTRLDTTPKKGFIPQPAAIPDDVIRIALPQDSHVSRLYNIHLDDEIDYNLLYRNHIDEEGQRQIEHFLMKGFKHTFRTFMIGALSCNTSQEIKDAILRFCEVYNIQMEGNITYEMLRKDWYRFRNREARGDVAAEIKENF